MGRSRLAIAAAVTALIALPNNADATTTRIYTLGAMNRFIVDDANKWLYPQAIIKYGNLFYLELFGSQPSRSTAAPGSERTMNTPAMGPGMLSSSTDLHLYDIADSVPVQQTAGGGAIVKITDEIFVALHLSDYENSTVPTLLSVLAGSSQGSPNAFPWLPNPPAAPGSANRKFDFFAAYNLQDIARFGLGLSYGSSKYVRHPNETDPQITIDNMMNTEARRTDEIGTSELGILLGGSVDIGEVATIDSGLGFKFHGLTYLPNQRSSLLGGGGGTEINADVRALIGITEWWELVPALSIRYMNVSASDLGSFVNGIAYNQPTATLDNQSFFITDVAIHRFIFDLGVAGHFRPTDFIDFWAATGIQFGYISAQFENTILDDPMGMPPTTRDQIYEFSRDTYSYNAIPYFRLAMEARVFSWLDFRGGVVKYLANATVKEDKLDRNPPQDTNNNRLNDVAIGAAFFDYFVGAALHYEGFFLDLQVDPNWFGRGPNFLSGAASPMFINASLGYRF
jgi:hypothetical protein